MNGGSHPGPRAAALLRSWWQHQPPGAFAFVMATGIVSGALQDAGWDIAGTVLLWVAAAGLVVLSAGLAGRLATRRNHAVADFSNPHAGFGYLTSVAALNVVGAGFHPILPAVTWTLGLISLPLWLFLAYGIPLSMIVRTERGRGGRSRLLPVDGTWFLWVVSTQSLAVAAATLATGSGSIHLLSAAALAFWGIGVMLYLTLTTLVILHLLTARELHGGIVPANWIFMGATAITVLAGALILRLPGNLPVVELTAPAVGGVSYLLWAYGLWWTPLLLAYGLCRLILWHVPLKYAGSLWLIVFPLGMFSVATFHFGQENRLPLMAQLGLWADWVAVAAWLLVAAGGAAAGVARLRRSGP
ncbi:tellurite resistance/C4-dicarboxylate transporter family protein [Arthrobacter sp. STN4]|uniref:tellurite resistance/C4-dicarboxylate transporter family protein n=1 Tax=Arthrobacter sp. STN4 TaxID=2923276 RepID=UPI002119DC7B|nr:tellurite resistance/C4-dicarboxylate transporter family protein [Arthrobacter sp. STN4]MCQ9164658.1 tellurite resistance/C4-dicarboxylate transporter family protein [Arthrobacter sp. STN4]